MPKLFCNLIGYGIMRLLAAYLLLALASVSCAQQKEKTNTLIMKDGLALATFGSGCFWCTEAVFQRVTGVEQVLSGYMGGRVKNPTYKEVTTGQTGHAEVIQLTYDPQKITYDELLEIFWGTHDPTTLNRQGADVGTQYRSVVFYHSEDQKKLAEGYKTKLNESGAFDDPIVTEISPAGDFYVAEDYHQNYFNLNSNVPYCTYVIQPKLEKFKKVFANKLKKG
jgi:peptide-methionine (S)-S-oxide reductase